jgi:hypothetical protein
MELLYFFIDEAQAQLKSSYNPSFYASSSIFRTSNRSPDCKDNQSFILMKPPVKNLLPAKTGNSFYICKYKIFDPFQRLSAVNILI